MPTSSDPIRKPEQPRSGAACPPAGRRSALAAFVCALLFAWVDGASSDDLKGRAPPASKTAPVPVILDTDLASDVDDVGDLAVLGALASLGEAKVLAVVTSSANPHSAPAAKVLLRFLGRSDAPVGAYRGAPSSGAAARSVYARALAERFGMPRATRAAFPSAVEVYRRQLSAARDRSVVIVATGFFKPLAALLRSPPDRYSELNGLRLVKRKASKLVVAAGFYPRSRQKPEYNFQNDAQAAHFVFARWPTRITAVGIELGETVWTGPPRQGDWTKTPVGLAYRLWGNETRQAWGQLAVLYAVRGLAGNFKVLGARGRITVDPVTGHNTWRPAPRGLHRYLGKLASDTRLRDTLNTLLARAVALPSGARRPAR